MTCQVYAYMYSLHINDLSPIRHIYLAYSDVDECLRTPCAAGGSCVNFDGGFRCDCFPGFQGTYCEEGNTTIHFLVWQSTNLTRWLFANANVFLKMRFVRLKFILHVNGQCIGIMNLFISLIKIRDVVRNAPFCKISRPAQCVGFSSILLRLMKGSFF